MGVRLLSLVLFQGKNAPTGNKSAKSTIKGVKAILKKGAPTDIFWLNKVSTTKGHKVPMNTTKPDKDNNKLFITKPLSLLISAN